MLDPREMKESGNGGVCIMRSVISSPNIATVVKNVTMGCTCSLDMETKNPCTISLRRLRNWKDNIEIDIRKADSLCTWTGIFISGVEPLVSVTI
jgi:hypothetical protein